MTMTTLGGWAFAALLVVTLPAHAQDVDLHQVDAHTSVLIGTSGNVVILAGPSGALLVDDERPTDVEDIQAAVARLTPAPIRFVIDTHWHLDHSGGNQALAVSGATIVAHRAVRERLGRDQYMAAYDRTVPASPVEALPTVVYDSEMDIHFEGERVHLIHTPAAHTDGDTLVRLDRANILHMGDVFFNGLFPFIDRSSGGSIQGLIAAVEVGLECSDENTTIVPAHGPLATRADLQAYRDMLVDIRDRVAEAIADGQPIEQIHAANLGANYALDGERERMIEAIRDSLLNAPTVPVQSGSCRVEG